MNNNNNMTIKNCNIGSVVNAALSQDNVYINDGIIGLIRYAYGKGRHEATVEVSDDYALLLTQQRERAKKEHYHNVANRCVGDVEYIHHYDYNDDIYEFAADPVDPEVWAQICEEYEKTKADNEMGVGYYD